MGTLRVWAWLELPRKRSGQLMIIWRVKFKMKIGTRSLLFGCHQFLLHPAFVLFGWVKLYGWPNWKELICIIIHDWGYWGCPNMDGNEGENHPKWAAWKAFRLLSFINYPTKCPKPWLWMREFGEGTKYYNLCLYHSRFYAKKLQAEPSKLCWADKLGTSLMPAWLWVFLSGLSGEQQEYMDNQRYEVHGHTCPYEFFKAYRNLVLTKLLPSNQEASHE